MNLEEAKLKLSKYGQEQILRYFDELSDDEKAALLEQIDKTDMEVLSAIEHKSELVKKGEITPLDAMELDEIKADYDTFKNTGVEAIKAGKVGAILLAGGMGTRLGSDNSALLIPIWPGYDRDVFNLSNINNMKDTDKGELKGLLVARGSIEVNYTDVPVMPEKEDYDLTTADGLQAYNDAMDAYNEKQEYYNKYIEPSAILSAIAGFDKLVNGIVTSLNDILCPEKTIETTKELTDNDGNVLQADEYIYNASVNATLYDRYGKEVKGVANGDGTYSYSSGEKLYVDQAGTTAENIDNMKYSVLDTDKAGFGTGASSLTRSFSRQHGSLEFDFTEVSSIYQFSVLYSTDLPILQPTTFDTHIHSRAQATFCVTPLLKRFEAVQEY